MTLSKTQAKPLRLKSNFTYNIELSLHFLSVIIKFLVKSHLVPKYQTGKLVNKTVNKHTVVTDTLRFNYVINKCLNRTLTVHTLKHKPLSNRYWKVSAICEKVNIR